MSEEWGPWIEHDGTDCPISAGKYIMAQGTSGKIVQGTIVDPSNSYGWNWSGRRLMMGYVIRYHIRKPEGLIILEQVLENLPAPVAPQPVGVQP